MRRCIRKGNAGFGITAVLYLLVLTGIAAGILFSGYAQTIRNNITLVKAISAKRDIDAASTTLAATSVLGGSAVSPLLCPPLVSGVEDTNCPAGTPISLQAIPESTDSHVPQASGGGDLETFLLSGTTPPLSVGIFLPVAGVKQLDPWGHYYLVCRWDSAPTTSDPAFQILSSGPKGVMNTTCGDTPTTASGNYGILVNAASAVNRASVWQVRSDEGTVTATYSATGVSVDSQGNLQVPGNFTVEGNQTITAGNLTMTSGSLTALRAILSDSVNVGAGNFLVNSSGFVTAISAALSSTFSAAAGSFSIGTTGDVSVGPSGTPTLVISASTGDLAAAGNMAAGGTVTIGSSSTPSTPSLNTYGPVHVATNVGTGGTAVPYLSVGQLSGGLYPFRVNQAGGIESVSLSASTGIFSGSLSADSLSANSATISDSLWAGSATVGGGAGTLTVNGLLTVNGAYTTQIGGPMNIGGDTVITGDLTVSGTITGATSGAILEESTGILPVSKGGTGAGTVPQGLINIGGNNASYITLGTLGYERLDTTGISNTGGPFNEVYVDEYGRVTSASLVSSDTLTDDYGNTITVGTEGFTLILGSVVQGVWNTTGLGIGTDDPTYKLTLYGPDSSLSGPHVAAYTSTDPTHPVFQQLNWTHDNLSLNFDAYYDGSWRSSSTTGNYQIYKNGGSLHVRYASSVSAGTTLTWTEGLILTSAGRFGIGTTSPGYKLDVNGNARITSTAYVVGSVGIGTASPAYKLHVIGSANITGNTTIGGDLAVGGSTTIGGDLTVTGTVVGATLDTLTDGAGDTLVISTTGLTLTLASTAQGQWTATGLGIGTTTPAYKLHVVGSSYVSSNSLVAGDMGIGTTTPGYKLHVVGSSYVSSNSLVAGDMGIGTTTPGYKLHVVGSSYVSSNSLVAGS
ncbi:MAG: hypothetical protein PHS57_01385, partial [Alphaproteobacteria bacterium]|nr:hypothetical protein [Alphaproteobacteria bacterium]